MRQYLVRFLPGAAFLVLLAGGCGDFDDASGAGEICGGLQGKQCGAGLFCDYPDESCGYADGSGVCRVAPEVCTEDSNPVCSCEGEVYPNACEANAAGTDVASPASCELRTGSH